MKLIPFPNQKCCDGEPTKVVPIWKSNEMTTWLEQIHWDEHGLIPVIVQEIGSNDVLMFAFMNQEALQQTVQRGEAVYWSRSRRQLWHKGEQSGHYQIVHEMRLDCDQDVILLKVEQRGGIACHTGRHSCFFSKLEVPENAAPRWVVVDGVLKNPERIYR